MRIRELLGLLLITLAPACADAQEEEPETSEGAIVGGTEARQAKFDAVVALAIEEDGEYQEFCTGTLIAPRVVMTAEHCRKAFPRAQVRVLFGADITSPRAVRNVMDEEEVTGESKVGMVGEGADVAFYAIESAVEGIGPIPMLERSLRAEDRGKSLLVVGYGTTTASKDGEPLPKGRTREEGIRYLAPEFLRTVRGGVDVSKETVARIEQWLSRHGYPSLEELKKEPAESETDEPESKRDTTLYEGYEAIVEDKGLGYTCQGDSGGPHLLPTRKGYVVAAVSSAVGSVGRVACLPGYTFVGTFGPLVQDARKRIEARLRDPRGGTGVEETTTK